MVGMLAACRDHTVVLGFDPKPGDRYRYRVEVTSESTLSLDDGTDERRSDRVVLEATHTVLEPDGGATRVRVELQDPLGAVRPRTFIVRYDRAGQLSGIDQLEALPADLLGDLGLSEIFPAAVGAPPDRPLSPGERWEIEADVELPGLEEGRIAGAGRLVSLGVTDVGSVATIATATTFELERSRVTNGSRTRVRGTQVNESSVTRSISDGAVAEATALTRGRYAIALEPDGAAAGGLSVTGVLSLTVRSSTTRSG